MNVQQFLLALRGRFWVFITLLGTTLAAAVVVTLLMPKTYDATVSVLVDNRDAQSLTASAQPVREQTGYMQTQIDVIRSERVARKVSEDLKLGEDPAAKRAFAASGAHGSIDDWIGGGLLTHLKVDMSQSSVILITYAASDPKFAAKVANAFAQAYMEVTLNLRVEPTKQAAAWFDDQLKSLRKDFEQAQARLAAFQHEHGIIASDEKVDVENARLAELSTQALAAQNATYDADSKARQSHGTATDSLPEVLASPLIQTLKAQVLTGEAKLHELSTRLGPNHPEYIQQKSEVDALRARLGAEMHKVVASVESSARQNRMHVADLQAALAAQRAKVVALRDARDQSTVLMRDVDTAQKAYEAALQRYLVNKVESGARQTNVTVLNEAVEPARPSKPKPTLNIALGLIVGLMLGLGAVFLLELVDRRVRSNADLEGALDAPLLGSLQPWQPSRLLGGTDSPRALPGPA
jgi:chain length determinant protein EpsF